MKRTLASLFITALFVSQAIAQNPGVMRYGPVANGDCVKWRSNTQIESGGSACNTGTVTSIAPADATIVTTPDPIIGTGTVGVGVIGTGNIGDATVTAGKLASGAAASNVGTLGGVLSGTLPNPNMASGAAATNVGSLGGDLTGTLPNPTIADGPTHFYETGTFTPVFTFATPGDLAVTYTTQSASYVRVGKIVTFNIRVALATLTYTTAAGTARITGFPFTNGTLLQYATANVGSTTFSAGYTQVIARLAVSGTVWDFFQQGSGVASSAMSVTNMPSGTSPVLAITGSIVLP